MRNQIWSVADIQSAKTPKQRARIRTAKAAPFTARDPDPGPASAADKEWRRSIKKGCYYILGLLEDGQLEQAKDALRLQTGFMPAAKKEPEVKKQNSAASSHTPWNKGQTIGQKPPLRAGHVWAIRQRLKGLNAKRDLALFNIAIDSKLIGCEVVRLKVKDVAPNGQVAEQAIWTQRNRRQVRFEIGEESRCAIADYLRSTGRGPEDFLFGGRSKGSLTSRQFARLVSQWIAGIGLDPLIYGTHSLRRAKAMLVYERTGNLRIVQSLLGHRKAETTVAYLGIGEAEDCLEAAFQAGI